MKNRNLKSFPASQSGVAAIEMAIILPLFLLLLISVIQFGIYFLKSEALSHSMITTTTALEKDVNTTDLHNIALDSGSSLTSFRSGNNYICAQAHKSGTPAAPCADRNVWNVTAANAGVQDGTSYLITVSAHSEFLKFSPVSDYLPPITQTRDIPINPSIASAGFNTIEQKGSGSCWYPPEGVNTAKVTIVGGGGGGYEPRVGSPATFGIMGGGAGGIIVAYFTGLPGHSTCVPYGIGQGGNYGVQNASTAQRGGDSFFNGITAGGGNGGGSTRVAGGTATAGQHPQYGSATYSHTAGDGNHITYKDVAGGYTGSSGGVGYNANAGGGGEGGGNGNNGMILIEYNKPQ